MTEDFESDYKDLQDTILRNSDADKAFQASTFFDLFAATAAEAGDVPDLDSVSVMYEGRLPYQVDGYVMNTDTRELVLAVTDYDNTESIRRINSDKSDRLFRRCLRFYELSCSTGFLDGLEESSDSFVLADLINSNQALIKRVRIVLLTNAVSARKKSIETEDLDGITVAKNLFDFSRYSKIITSQSGSEPIEIDFADFDYGPIPCLEASSQSADYISYLCVMPGPLLADLYSTYSAKLLEQNVRVFLQARTKVNKGMIETIASNPEMFFAYNNGLTVTASEIETAALPNGKLGITNISNLQIVNGGQTTAAILYARDVSKSNLEAVSVQMKLAVIPEDKLEEIVPRISRYSNTQNRISEADFFSSHPFHAFMERTGQRMLTPVQHGTSTGSKWFYERARGQYRNRQTYMSTRDRNRFISEFPKNQLLLKTDIAKYEMSIAQKPFVVSKGAQKCFMEFSNLIADRWVKNETGFNDLFYQKTVAHAIVFRSLDNHIARSEWYKAERGYKAEIVTYTIAYFMFWLAQNKVALDEEEIWKNQELEDNLVLLLDEMAQKVRGFITDTPPSVANVREYCKKEDCWKALKSVGIQLDKEASDFGISKSEAKENTKQAVKQGQMDKELGFETRLFTLGPKVDAIISDARRLKVLSPASDRGLAKLKRGAFNLPAPEKVAVKELLKRLSEFDLEY